MKHERTSSQSRLRPGALVPSRGSRTPERGPTAPLPLPAAGPAPSPDANDGETRRVLLAHVDPAQRRRLRDHLRTCGFDVVTLDSGFEVLGNAQPWVFRGVSVEPPDAIVCTTSLPDWSGADVLRILRAGDDRTPFVALVDRYERGSRTRLLALGADAVVGSKVDAAELADVVRTVVRRREEMASWSQAA